MRSIAAVLVALLGVLGARFAHSADQGTATSEPSIEVTGNGEVAVDPDRATLIIAVETGGATSAAAAAENARLTTAVTDALLTAGAARSDIVTANYTVLPQRQYSSNAPPKRVGYEAQNTMRVSVRQLAVLGKWMDAALGAGAARVENIEFDSGEAETARLDALAKAVANARAEAETLAKAAGGRLGPLQELTTAQPGGPLPLVRMAAPAPLSVREETHIEPSSLHITATVTVRWGFEP